MCKSCKIGISTKNPSEIWNFLCYSLFMCFYTTSFCSFYVLAKKSPPKSFCMHQELTRLLARLEQKNVRSTFPSLTHYIYSDIHFLQQTHTYTYAHTHTMLVLNNNLLEGREREREQKKSLLKRDVRYWERKMNTQIGRRKNKECKREIKREKRFGNNKKQTKNLQKYRLRPKSTERKRQRERKRSTKRTRSR